MPAERLSMRKIREVLRLHFACGLSKRRIARAVGIGSSSWGSGQPRDKAKVERPASCNQQVILRRYWLTRSPTHPTGGPSAGSPGRFQPEQVVAINWNGRSPSLECAPTS